MTELIAGALWASIAGTAIAVLLATIVGTFIRLQRPAAATRCILWLIVLSTCLLAPAAILGAMSLPSVRFAAHADGVKMARASSTRRDLERPVRMRGSALVPRTLLQRPPLTSVFADALGVVWLGGSLVGCIGLLRSVARVRALKRRSSPLDGSLVDELPWLTERAGREIYLRLSYEIETPIAIGFRRPVILIPTEMATLAGLTAIEPLVMHEYAHLARYDDWTNLWQRLIERIAWWNPLVWYAGRRLALEREVTADDAVVHRTHDRTHYASMLWRLAREMRMPEHVVVAPGALLTRKQISVRIERVLDESATRSYAGAGFALAAIAACAVMAVAASAPRLDFKHFVSPAPIRPLARNINTSSSIAHLSQRAAEHATILHPVVAVAAVRIAQTVPSTPPMKAITPASKGLSPRMRGPFHAGCNGCDLQDADLHGQDFSGAHFRGANMQNADLHDAKFRGAVLIGVNLENANLDGADLRGARVIGTNFDGASMRGTLTTGASFTGSSLP